MIGSFTKGRVYVFVDAANILYSQQTLRWKVDYKRLKEYFKKECDLRAIYFYTGRVGENDKQNHFLKKLEELGYVVKAKEVKRIRVSKSAFEWKGNLDVELTIDVLKNIDNFDTLILMSGDSDFASLLDTVKSQNKRVLVMSTKGHISRELIQRAKYINLKKLRDFVSYGK
ncbi:MAG: NYN domain-containing protein [Candidatus Liptonbacteria bacterium]|nr:NYN domain-containing protein [Candidatus Liptonbacteria bacterium]